MSLIQKTFEKLRTENRKALITYWVAGDPDLEKSLDALHACVTGGADILEIGMAFTDPMADGAVIQAAHLRALAAGVTLQKTLNLVKKFREINQTTPIVLMGYANPILSFGIDSFFEAASLSGVNGVLIVDVPPEEDEEWYIAAREYTLDFIRLATPTTNNSRLEKILKHASGFLYYISVAGITGALTNTHENLAAHIEEIKKEAKIPVCIGFGINTREKAQTMAKLSDGIVVGSALIEGVQIGKNLKDLAKEFRV